MVEKWSKLQSDAIGDYRIFRIRRDLSRSPRTGDTHSFFVLESADWINVIPVTASDKVVLIHQFRHGTEEVCLEIPGGMADPEDTTPAAAAERELVEETGYTAERIIPIGSVTPNPAFLTNRCHTFLALGAKRVAQPKLDAGEDIEVMEFDLDQVPDLISSGRISHALVVAAFYHFDRYIKKNPNWRNGA